MDYLSSEYIQSMQAAHERLAPKLYRLGKSGAPIFSRLYPKETFVKLNLSPTNNELVAMGSRDPDEFTDFIFDYIASLGGKVGYGGYFEDRRWYQKSTVFDEGVEPRDVHIGLDLWVQAGTEILCPLDGKVHSFKDNAQFLDYGPTVILEHNFEGEKFYSLYGHLSEESLKNKSVGQEIKAGEVFAWIGSSPTNGQWPAHLHLQLMLDMQGIEGDFPGVCAKSKRKMYEAVCPNPELLLGLVP